MSTEVFSPFMSLALQQQQHQSPSEQQDALKRLICRAGVDEGYDSPTAPDRSLAPPSSAVLGDQPIMLLHSVISANASLATAAAFSWHECDEASIRLAAVTVMGSSGAPAPLLACAPPLADDARVSTVPSRISFASSVDEVLSPTASGSPTSMSTTSESDVEVADSFLQAADEVPYVEYAPLDATAYSALSPSASTDSLSDDSMSPAGDLTSDASDHLNSPMLGDSLDLVGPSDDLALFGKMTRAPPTDFLDDLRQHHAHAVAMDVDVDELEQQQQQQRAEEEADHLFMESRCGAAAHYGHYSSVLPFGALDVTGKEHQPSTLGLTSGADSARAHSRGAGRRARPAVKTAAGRTSRRSSAEWHPYNMRNRISGAPESASPGEGAIVETGPCGEAAHAESCPGDEAESTQGLLDSNEEEAVEGSGEDTQAAAPRPRAPRSGGSSSSSSSSRRRGRRGTGPRGPSPASQNFRVEVNDFNISILVLRHQGNDGRHPTEKNTFYYQARIRNVYPQKHLWAGWDTREGIQERVTSLVHQYGHRLLKERPPALIKAAKRNAKLSRERRL